MSVLVAYGLGFFTPFFIAGASMLWVSFREWLAARRYRLAYDKFAAEFADLTPGQLEFFKRKWADEQHSYMHASGQDRHFAMRWQNGRTTEV